ncbi:MAG TPA: Fic family protein [Terracidiphilus sp.]|jgi:Fic family protein|nr:Fic family protein [Terracidiphilus sp.]
MIRYELPSRWILYDSNAVMAALVEAKSAVRALTTLPYQKSWVEALQELQLKREVAGTSRIEGAEFTERELDEAVRTNVSPEELHTRSQRQARAAMQTYRWIGELPADRPTSADLVREVHRRLVTGCDEDHCPPGVLRGRDYNVTFGIPQHQGAEGGPACEEAFAGLLQAAQTEFHDHDPLVQAMALHYHLAAMHPFLDGNGRTARAMEALLLRRAELTDRAFVAMSNYYYDEKPAYLRILSEVRQGGHDLTPFLIFALQGVRIQCERLTAEIRKHMQRALFRDTMYSLFHRLKTKRKRVIGARQVEILKVLLEQKEAGVLELFKKTEFAYKSVKDGTKAFVRDLSQLEALQAIRVSEGPPNFPDRTVSINLDWPQEIDEGEFLRRMKSMPKGKTFKFLT